MGLSISDRVAPTLQESLHYPSLNIPGMRSAWVGPDVRTIIPATAVAEIDIRLVMESDPDYLAGLVKKHIAALGYAVVDHEPTMDERLTFNGIVKFVSNTEYAAFRTDFDSSAGPFARNGMKNLFGEEPVLIRTMGGSIPIAPFIDILRIPAATVSTVNIDNNQNSPNENIRIANFAEGISIIMSVLNQPAE